MRVDDASLRHELEARVHLRTGRRVRNLAVQVHAGRVVLRGQAASYHVKQLAQHGVLECAPALAVENAIVVAR